MRAYIWTLLQQHMGSYGCVCVVFEGTPYLAGSKAGNQKENPPSLGGTKKKAGVSCLRLDPHKLFFCCLVSRINTNQKGVPPQKTKCPRPGGVWIKMSSFVHSGFGTPRPFLAKTTSTEKVACSSSELLWLDLMNLGEL